MSSELQMDLDGRVRALFMEFLPVFNPTGGEAELLEKVAGWLRERGIECVSDTSWGLWFQYTDTSDPMREAQDPLLLMAHLDSEERYLDRKGMAGIKYNVFADEFCFRGPIGLDCKTGIVMVLAIVEQIMSGLIPGASVKVLFTVAEEIGQRGLLRMPRDVLAAITQDVKFVIALDRSTEAGGDLVPGRHVIKHYCGVDMISPGGQAWLDKMLRLACISAKVPLLIQTESPNCSDILELKMRHECELVLPAAAEHADSRAEWLQLKKLLSEYTLHTEKFREMINTAEAENPGSRPCGMSESPRSDRYEVARQVSKWLAKEMENGVPGTGVGSLSAVNLSYSYSDPLPRKKGSCSVQELCQTSRLVLALIHHNQKTAPLIQSDGDDEA
eukprot:jgi/Tetstr1/463765/TSEL_008581.t1